MINIYHNMSMFVLTGSFARPNEPTIDWNQNKGTTPLRVYPVTVTMKFPFHRNTYMETF